MSLFNVDAATGALTSLAGPPWMPAGVVPDGNGSPGTAVAYAPSGRLVALGDVDGGVWL